MSKISFGPFLSRAILLVFLYGILNVRAQLKELERARKEKR